MEQRFALEGGGTLTVQENGLRAVVTARRPNDGKGLYRAYLQGPEARVLLGTMSPEGGSLSVQRALSLDELRRQGVWPPRGGSAELSFSFSIPDAPPGWRWCDPSALDFQEAELQKAAARLGRTLCRREGEGFSLAYPFSCRESFPLPALFCLAETAELSGRRYVLFHFNALGWPLLPERCRQNGSRKRGT